MRPELIVSRGTDIIITDQRSLDRSKLVFGKTKEEFIEWLNKNCYLVTVTTSDGYSGDLALVYDSDGETKVKIALYCGEKYRSFDNCKFYFPMSVTFK